MISLSRICTLSCCALLFLGVFNGCKKKETDPVLVGSPGNPRFNLQFDNESNVDLDLYVTDPRGETIYYNNWLSQSGGELDVDCRCEDCSTGPNENIFWPEDDSAPKGTYKYWVEYYENCGTGTSSRSNFTVRVTFNRKVIATHTGSLSSGRSETWTYVNR